MSETSLICIKTLTLDIPSELVLLKLACMVQASPSVGAYWRRIGNEDVLERIMNNGEEAQWEQAEVEGTK